MASVKRIPLAQPVFSKKESVYVNQCLQSTWISSRGPFLHRFEQAFAISTHRRFANSTCNGTVSLHLILVALGIGKGDEVIVPTLTYVASVNAILYVGAKPVFVDADPLTYTMHVEDIERKITKKTKAIMAVHLYGVLCDMERIQAIAHVRRLSLIEDAAEAHGATDRFGSVAGSFGVASSFSFFGNKTITTGEGGMVTTDSARLHRLIGQLKNQGQSSTRRYFHPMLGYNYRMTNIEAAIGLAQLERLRVFVEKKRQIRGWYEEALVEDVARGRCCLQQSYEGDRPSCWMTALTVEGVRPAAVAHVFERDGIDTRPFFAPVHAFPYLRDPHRFPVAASLHRRGIILPSALTLTRADVDHVVDRLHKHLP